MKVFYPERCLNVAVTVGQRLINLGADPELTEGVQRNLLRARATYAREEQLGLATTVAAGLSEITPIDVVLDARGREPDSIQLQLIETRDCR